MCMFRGFASVSTSYLHPLPRILYISCLHSHWRIRHISYIMNLLTSKFGTHVADIELMSLTNFHDNLSP